MTAAELIEKWKDVPTIETHAEMGCTGLECSRCAAIKLAQMLDVAMGAIHPYCDHCTAKRAAVEKIAGGVDNVGT